MWLTIIAAGGHTLTFDQTQYTTARVPSPQEYQLLTALPSTKGPPSHTHTPTHTLTRPHTHTYMHYMLSPHAQAVRYYCGVRL